MANRLEKFEKLFGGSRKRDRERSKAIQPKDITVITQQPSSPTPRVFPSPSYLRPTSMHMTPRAAQVDADEREKGRSHSVPGLPNDLFRRVSNTSSTTAVDCQNTGSPSPRVSLLNEYPSALQATPRLSGFRFPEDSLFKNDELLRISGETLTRDTDAGDAPPLRTMEGNQTVGLLDWKPKHISLLFNPREIEACFADPFRNHDTPTRDAIRDSTLLPSPMLLNSTKSSDTITHARSPKAAVELSGAEPRVPHRRTSQRLNTHPRPPPVSLPHRVQIETPPASDSDEAAPATTVARSMSFGAMSSPRPTFDPRMSVEPDAKGKTVCFHDKLSIRETWGSRWEDPTFFDSPRSSYDGIPRSRLSQRSASEQTISMVTAQIVQDSILKEPTFDDFYALSDEDIAESRPVTPEPDPCVPPTPPPKDDDPNPLTKPKEHPLEGHRATAQKNTIAVQVPPELTPPCTPRDSRCLTLTYSPSTPHDALGAIWAAELANKYQFSVVYVLSLWPAGAGDCSDLSTTPSPRPSHRKFQGRGVLLPDSALDTQRTPTTHCRLLAAYGLNEIPSPFKIFTDIHVQALGCQNWSEYRNDDALAGDFSRGWIRPFYGDHIPTSEGNTISSKNTNNRGIIFAAYDKQSCVSVIPTKTSPDKEALLERLQLDAKAFVDALIGEAAS
ncbi:hypothetical protein F4780DRAFT_679427 [Xylariomycetidae sp. FL0641]|nr:hypothetical protein F4780DRAFT_679427 [Xylariomycetidae sp. FL0641]